MSHVVRWYTGSMLNNYNHLIVSDVSENCVVVDPFDPQQAIKEAAKVAKKIIAILVTHEHRDHYQGAKALSDLTGAQIYAHISNQTDLPRMDIAVKEGDELEFAEDLQLTVLETPGHLKGHVCFYSEADKYIVSGDVLFNAGMGSVRFHSSSIEALYHSMQKLSQLPKDVRIYPAHDYFQNNLGFMQNIDSDNQQIPKWLNKLDQQTPETRATSTLGDEHEYNLFLNVDKEEAAQKVAKRAGLETLAPGLKTFKVLRELRDNW
ncbi:hydroxyacylglutathione hydrolase [Francisellaceae bacterium]|nr:hydroxyacylglutathione hydrolase [Francisellaceae bacterium]